MTEPPLTPLHLDLIRALAEDAVRRGILTNEDAARAFLEAPAPGNNTLPEKATRQRRDSGHDLNRSERVKRAGKRVAAGIDSAATFAESWPGIATGFVFVAAMAWHRWPILEVIA